MITGVIMAAGLSKRFGNQDKLLYEINGDSMAYTLGITALESNLDFVLFVYSNEKVAEEFKRAMDHTSSKKARLIYNSNPEYGQSRSICLGVKSIPQDCQGIMFLTCDQPQLDSNTINHLIHVFNGDKSHIVIPMAEGLKGSPVIFPKEYFRELETLEGDTGGRLVINNHLDKIYYIEVPKHILRDIDYIHDVGGHTIGNQEKEEA